MIKHNVRIGVICLARRTFDFQAALEIYQKIQGKLKYIDGVEWEFVPELLIDVSDAQKAADLLATKLIDGLICISGTFALGHLILEINKKTRCPILLWGLMELPYDGGKIRLNSVCGINLNTSNLYKAGIKNYHVVFGDEVDENWIDAIRIKKVFSNAHVGILGSRAHGFFNLDVSELELYEKLGVLVDYYQLNDVLNLQINYHELNRRKEQIETIFDTSTLNSNQIEKVAELIVRFETFMSENALTSLAIRCWPEFANIYGISPCAAMSVLQSEGRILTCEGDLLGSLSMLAHAAIGAENPFLADFSQVNFEENFGLLWHCGVASCNLWDGTCVRSLDTYFAGGKGVTADFVMKSGELSLLRIDYAPPNEYRIFLQRGKAIPMKKDLKGTYAKVIFNDHVRTVLNKIIENGIAHHISVVYGEFIKPLEIFAKIVGWKIIQ